MTSRALLRVLTALLFASASAANGVLNRLAPIMTAYDLAAPRVQDASCAEWAADSNAQGPRYTLTQKELATFQDLATQAIKRVLSRAQKPRCSAGTGQTKGICGALATCRAVRDLQTQQDASSSSHPVPYQTYEDAVAKVHSAAQQLHQLQAYLSKDHSGASAHEDTNTETLLADLHSAEKLLHDAEEHLKDAGVYFTHGARSTAHDEVQAAMQTLQDVSQHIANTDRTHAINTHTTPPTHITHTTTRVTTPLHQLKTWTHSALSTLRRMVQAPIMPLAHAGHTFSTHAHDTAEQGAAGQGHVTAKAEVAASAQVVSVKVQRGERGGKDTLGRAREEAHEAKEHLERAGELAVEAGKEVTEGVAAGAAATIHTGQGLIQEAASGVSHAAHAAQHAVGAGRDAAQQAGVRALHAADSAAATATHAVKQAAHSAQHAAKHTVDRAQKAAKDTAAAATQAASQAAAGAQHAATAGADAAANTVKHAAAGAQHATNTAAHNIKQAATTAQQAAAAAASTVKDAAAGVQDAVQDAAHVASHAARTAVDTAQHVAKDTVRTAAQAAKTAAAAATHTIKHAAESTQHAAQTATAAATHATERVITSGGKLFTDAEHAAIRAGAAGTAAAVGAAGAVADAARRAAAATQHAAVTQAHAVRNTAEDAAHFYSENLAHSRDALKSAVHGAVDSTVEATKAATQAVKQGVADVGSRTQQVTHAAADKTAAAGAAVRQGVQKAAKVVGEGVQDTVHSAVSQTEHATQQAGQAVREGVQSVAHTLHDAAEQAKDSLQSTVHAVKHTATEVGQLAHDAAAAGAAKVQQSAHTVGQRVHDATEQLAHAAASVKQHAAHADHTLTQRAEQAAETAAQTADTAGAAVSNATAQAKHAGAEAARAGARWNPFAPLWRVLQSVPHKLAAPKHAGHVQKKVAQHTGTHDVAQHIESCDVLRSDLQHSAKVATHIKHSSKGAKHDTHTADELRHAVEDAALAGACTVTGAVAELHTSLQAKLAPATTPPTHLPHAPRPQRSSWPARMLGKLVPSWLQRRGTVQHYSVHSVQSSGAWLPPALQVLLGVSPKSVVHPGKPMHLSEAAERLERVADTPALDESATDTAWQSVVGEGSVDGLSEADREHQRLHQEVIVTVRSVKANLAARGFETDPCTVATVCRLPNLEQGKHQGLGSKLVSLLAERAEVLRHKLAQFVSVGNLSDLGQAMQRVVSHVTG